MNILKKFIERSKKMTDSDKAMYIAGVTFLTLATALFITGIFIPKALGVALLTATVSYIFFDCYYYGTEE